MIALLDTSVLIASGSASEADPDLRGFEDLRVSALSWAELTKGLHTTTSLAVYKQRLARLGELQRTFGAGLPFDDECVAAYDRVLIKVAGRGASPRAHVIDRMLAATAIAYRCTLITRDARAFVGLEQLVAVDTR